MPPIQVGGSFAPPLTDAKLSAYMALADALPAGSRIKDAMGKLLACCAKWWNLPEPNGTTARSSHPSGRGNIIALEKAHADALFDLIPWSASSNGTGKPDELEAIGDLFETIDNGTDKPLRDAAFHLLWLVKELDLDREPLTSDQL